MQQVLIDNTGEQLESKNVELVKYFHKSHAQRMHQVIGVR